MQNENTASATGVNIIKSAPNSVQRAYGDGAYDTEKCYQACNRKRIEPVIPPQKNGVYRSQAPPHMKTRNTNILEILGLGGDDDARVLWKKMHGYHRRSLGETAMFRMKRFFGNDLRNRKLETQKAETRARCEALNMMTRLGMPKGEWVEV